MEREPENPAFVTRYARFVVLADRNLHIELLERAQSLDTGNAHFARDLGHAYLLASMRPEENDYDPQFAEKALRQFDRAYGLANNDIVRNSMLRDRARAAFAARRYDLAKQHAQAMLDANSTSDPDGDLLHGGNTILGRIALIEGDVARAKVHLCSNRARYPPPLARIVRPEHGIGIRTPRARPTPSRARLSRTLRDFLGRRTAARLASYDQCRHDTGFRFPSMALMRIRIPGARFANGAFRQPTQG